MERFVRWNGRLQSQKVPVEPTMYMKTQGLRGNSRLAAKILSDSIKSGYSARGQAEWEKNTIKNRG
jgi:hypothetical protein